MLGVTWLENEGYGRTKPLDCPVRYLPHVPRIGEVVTVIGLGPDGGDGFRIVEGVIWIAIISEDHGVGCKGAEATMIAKIIVSRPSDDPCDFFYGFPEGI